VHVFIVLHVTVPERRENPVRRRYGVSLSCHVTNIASADYGGVKGGMGRIIQMKKYNPHPIILKRRSNFC